MPIKTGFIQPENPQETKTDFEQKWGEPAYIIAEREGISTAGVHQRVHLYDTPFQRKAKPSKWEAKYGKTKVEICRELYIHPNSLILREKTHGNVYCEDKLQNCGTYRNTKLPMFSHTKHWTELPHFKGDRFWLTPEHPDYQAQRDLCLQWNCQKHISLAKAKI